MSEGRISNERSPQRGLHINTLLYTYHLAVMYCSGARADTTAERGWTRTRAH